MKKLMMLLVIAIAGSFLFSGCSGLSDSRAERSRRIKQITELQMKMLVDDWDYLWLYERNSRNTQWHTWVGI